MPPDADHLDVIRRQVEQIRRLDREAGAARQIRDQAIVAAINDLQFDLADVAVIAGLSTQRVHQILAAARRHRRSPR